MAVIVRAVVELTNLQHRHDAGIADPRQQLGLVQEPLAHLGSVRRGIAQEFDRDLGARLEVATAEHVDRAGVAEAVEHLVGAEAPWQRAQVARIHRR
jgi:hypothetical protein